ncbi:RidA family protein [Roseibium sp. HPY-6]|uniref:RidA family protein n=1 Tax=Roseibium sp. HPY-6 TaxID=3229852 RepID=UPI00338DEE30
MIERLNPTTLRAVPDQYAGIYTHSTRLDHPKKLVAFSGQVGVANNGAVASDFAGQCHQAMDHVEALLDAHRLGLDDMMRVTYYVTRGEDLAELTEIRQTRWHSSNPPAVTTLIIAGLVDPNWLIEIEVLAGN